MIDEDAGARRLEAQRHLLAGIDQRQPAAAERAGGGVEIDVVRHLVGGRVDQGELHVVALVHHHQRTGQPAVVGHGPHLGAGIVDDDLLLDDVHGVFDHLGCSGGRLLVGMDQRRLHQVDADVFEAGDVLAGGGGEDRRPAGGGKRRECGADQRLTTGNHGSIPLVGVFYGRTMRLPPAFFFVRQQRPTRLPVGRQKRPGA